MTSNSFTNAVAMSAELIVSKPGIVEIVRKTSAVPGATVMTAVAVGVLAAVAGGVAVGTAVLVSTADPVTEVVAVVLGVVVMPVALVMPAVLVTPVVFVMADEAGVAVGALASGVWVGVGVTANCGLFKLQLLKNSAATSVLVTTSKIFFIRRPLKRFMCRHPKFAIPGFSS